MKPFYFKLDKLLEYRKHLEFQEKQKFAQVLQKNTALQSKIKLLQDQYDKMFTTKQVIIHSADLQFLYYHNQAMELIQSEIHKLASDLKKQEEPLNKAQDQLNKVLAQRKSLEVLKNKALMQHNKELDKKEQSMFDDYAIYYFQLKQNKYFAGDIHGLS